MADIIELILAGRQRILLMAEALPDLSRSVPGSASSWALASVWDRLADVIEMQADAEEEICYLPVFGTSPSGLRQLAGAVADLGEIREAVSETRVQPVGSAAWWRPVRAALSSCVDHFGHQEQTVLARFAAHADRSLRQRLGGQWLAFTAARIGDLAPDGQLDGRSCWLCQWPIHASHRHILDTKACAVLCACSCCYALHQCAAQHQPPATEAARLPTPDPPTSTPG